MPGFPPVNATAGFVPVDHGRGGDRLLNRCNGWLSGLAGSPQTVVNRALRERDPKDIQQHLLQALIREMVGVLEVDDHTLEPRAEGLLGVTAGGRRGEGVNATVRAIHAVLLHFNHLGADGRKLEQLVTTFKCLRRSREVGSTALAGADALLGVLIGCLAPVTGGAGMAGLRSVLGFVLSRALLGLLVAGGRLGGIGRGGGRLGRRQPGFQLLDAVDQLDNQLDQSRFVQFS